MRAFLSKQTEPGRMAHAFNSRTKEAEVEGSRLALSTQRNPQEKPTKHCRAWVLTNQQEIPIRIIRLEAEKLNRLLQRLFYLVFVYFLLGDF